MKVLQSKVLVQVDNDQLQQKLGNFTVPVEDIEKATVIEVGNEVNKDGEILKLGDKVYIYPKSGKEFMENGEKYRVITLNEIIVVL